MGAKGGGGASRGGVVIVVSDPDDLPGMEGKVVAAHDFLEGTQQAGQPRDTVVNLCRSLKYLSKGYYVSLLADARGQRPLPAVDTIKSMGSAHAVFRALQEADIETITPSAMQARRRSLRPQGSKAAPKGQGLVVKEVRDEIHVSFRPARKDEEREVTLCLGRTLEKDLERMAATIYRVWPVPLLWLRLMKEDGEWKVVDVAAVAVHQLTDDERALLVEGLQDPKAGESALPTPPKDKHLALAILYDETDKFGPSTTETIEKIERIGSRMGVHVQRIGIHEKASLGDYDALLIRTLTGLNQPAFRFATKAEALGMPVVDDTQSIIRCSNKVFLHELLKREGVPMPRTVVASPHTKFETLEKELGLPLILKLPDGSFSTAVHKLSSRADYREVAGEMFKSSPLIVAQAYTPTDFDWRVTTLGGKVLFVAKYHMARGHWQIRAADARGVRFGRVEAVPRQYAPRDVVRVALKAATLIGDGLYGVDVKETPDGPVVIEVNDNPNLDVGYDDAADGNAIYEDLIQHFLDRVEEEQKPPAPRPVRRTQDVIMRALRRPIGPSGREMPNVDYRAFEVCGIELEYATVDRDLNVVPLVEPLLAALAGHPTSDVDLGSVGFSNEIVDHVFEMKVPVPSKSLAPQEGWLAEAVRRVSALLADHFDARLMPTGMHPWFDPRKANLWVRSNAKIYGTYERIFDVRTHGWANVQACHVNLPLGLEDEATAMMNAATLLVPYLPAIAASTPMYAGEIQAAMDNRLAFIVGHQERIPESTGHVVPEYVKSLREYRRTVLQPMYAAVDRLPDAQAIRREFLNARGAVIKFSRKSMEVRVLDMQECVRMDVAIAAFVRAALRALAELVRQGRIDLPDHALLVADFYEAVRHGTKASVRAPHLRTSKGEDPVPVTEVLHRLVDMARKGIRKDEAPYLDLVAAVVEHGSLAERIVRALTPYVDDEDGFTDQARRVYVELTDCLRFNEPWVGRTQDRAKA